jgi:hypothetical protein
MPRSLEVCRSETSPICSDGLFDDRIRAVQDVPEIGLPIPLDEASSGSLLIESDPETDFHFGEFPNQSVAFTSVSLLGLDKFALQSHQEDLSGTSCTVFDVDCQRGYLAIDTGWDPESPPSSADIDGIIKVVKSTTDITELDFVPEFAADRRIFAFERSGAVSGTVITGGAVNCPSGLSFKSGGTTITNRFCKGGLFE